jgi:lysophospholipase L1-like esterase
VSSSTIASPANKKTKRSHWFLKGVLWFVVICVFLEIALRPFGYGHYVIYKPDQQLLWVPIPGDHKVTEVNHEPETISSQGFRYKQTLSLDHPGIYRIFTFGDSVTMGWGVADDKIYSAQLERMLNAQGCPNEKFQVISAGVNAYPQSLTVERLKRVLDDGYKPDAMVLAFSFNTGFDELDDLQGKAREDFLKKVQLKSWVRRSALYNFTIEGLLRSWVYYRIRGRIMLGTWDTAASIPNAPADHYIKELQAAKDAADAHHAPLIFLLMGTIGEFQSTHPYQKAMWDFAQQNHIPIVNMMDVVKNYKNQDDVFEDHVHPTVLGHTLIAQQLDPVVRSLPSYAAACNPSTPPPTVASAGN